MNMNKKRINLLIKMISKKNKIVFPNLTLTLEECKYLYNHGISVQVKDFYHPGFLSKIGWMKKEIVLTREGEY